MYFLNDSCWKYLSGSCVSKVDVYSDGMRQLVLMVQRWSV